MSALAAAAAVRPSGATQRGSRFAGRNAAPGGRPRLSVLAAKSSTPPDVPKPRPGEERKNKAEWFQAILSK